MLQSSDRERWNRRYRQEGPEAFGDQPVEWLAAHEDLLRQQPRGMALDVACGNGRNARFLAQLGFTVEAVDISDVVIEWLKEQVSRWKLPIHPRVADLAQAQLPSERYQVIINLRFLERRLFSAMKSALLPGGLLIFETFTREHADALPHPVNPEYLLQPNELLHSFLDLHILHYREGTIIGKDGFPKSVASLVARKPMP